MRIFNCWNFLAAARCISGAPLRNSIVISCSMLEILSISAKGGFANCSSSLSPSHNFSCVLLMMSSFKCPSSLWAREIGIPPWQLYQQSHTPPSTYGMKSVLGLVLLLLHLIVLPHLLLHLLLHCICLSVSCSAADGAGLYDWQRPLYWSWAVSQNLSRTCCISVPSIRTALDPSTPDECNSDTSSVWVLS